jgi:hypothetical protein
LALGGQAYSEIIFFETPANVDKFKSGNFAFSAQATAVALKSGAGANAKPRADSGGDSPFDYHASEEISEDLPVSLPADI